MRKLSELKIGQVVVSYDNNEYKKTMEKADAIKKELADIRAKMVSEHKSGKSEAVLKPLHDKWEATRKKMFHLWKAYDNTHHTKYSQQYVVAFDSINEEMKKEMHHLSEAVLTEEAMKDLGIDTYHTQFSETNPYLNDLRDHGHTKKLNDAIKMIVKIRHEANLDIEHGREEAGKKLLLKIPAIVAQNRTLVKEYNQHHISH